MNIFEEIVRELADVDPYESGNGRCQECWATVHQDHSPNCLWLRARRAVEFDAAGVMHATVDQETGRFPCCGKTNTEVPASDRMTLDPQLSPVTCGVTVEPEA